MAKNKKLNLGILSLFLISMGGGVLSTAETIEDAKRQIDENNKIIGGVKKELHILEKVVVHLQQPKMEQN